MTAAGIILLIMAAGPQEPEPIESRLISEMSEDLDGTRQILFLPEGKGVLYVGLSARSGKASIWNNDKPGVEFDEVLSPILSPNGKTLAYVAQSGKKQFAIVGDQRHPEFDRVTQPFFNSDGKIVAYRAHIGRHEVMVIDGKAGRHFDKVHAPMFNPTSGEVAYIAVRDGRDYVVVGEKERGNYDAAWFPVWSSDGRVLAYGARDKGRQFIVAGETPGPTFDEVSLARFTPDGRTVFYVARRESQWLVVIGEKEVKQETAVFNPVVDSSGALLAFGFKKGGEERMVVRGIEGPVFDGIVAYWVDPQMRMQWQPVVSPDFKCIAYRGVRAKKGYLVVNQTVGEAFDGLNGPVFSRDGSRFAYVGIRNKRYRVVAGSRLSPSYHYSSVPTFSGDGKSISFGAQIDRSFYWMNWVLR